MEDVRSVSGGQMGMDKGLRLVTHGVDRVRFGIRSVEGQPEADSCPKSIPPQQKLSRACLINPQGNSKSSLWIRRYRLNTHNLNAVQRIQVDGPLPPPHDPFPLLPPLRREVARVPWRKEEAPESRPVDEHVQAFCVQACVKHVLLTR